MLRLSISLFALITFGCRASAATVSLETLPLNDWLQQGNRPRANESSERKPLSVGGTVFLHGIGSHANSVWLLQLDGKSGAFTASVGVDDNCGGKPALQFIVEGDDRTLWKSSYLHIGQPPESVHVELAGITRLKLWVTARGENSNADADWIDPVVKYTDAAPIPLSTTWAQMVGPEAGILGVGNDTADGLEQLSGIRCERD